MADALDKYLDDILKPKASKSPALPATAEPFDDGLDSYIGSFKTQNAPAIPAPVASLAASPLAAAPPMSAASMPQPPATGGDDLDKYLDQITPPAAPRPKQRRIGGQTTAQEVDDLLNGEHGQKVRQFFNAVQWAEGGQPDLIVGGKQRFNPNTDHPNIVGLTTPEGPSTAAGNYQITGSNWFGRKGGAGLKQRLGAKNFSAENQLRAALMLFGDRDNRAGFDALKRGDYETAMRIAAKDWAAVPGSTLHKNKSGRNRNEFMKRLGMSSQKDALDTYLDQFMPEQSAAETAGYIEAPESDPLVVGGYAKPRFPTPDGNAPAESQETEYDQNALFASMVDPNQPNLMLPPPPLVNPNASSAGTAETPVISVPTQPQNPQYFTTEDGRNFVVSPDQSGLQADEIRVRDMMNPKGGFSIAKRIKDANGQESIQIPFPQTEEVTDRPQVQKPQQARAVAVPQAAQIPAQSGDAEYRKYLTYTQKADSPENRKEFENLLAQNQSFGQVEVSAESSAPEYKGTLLPNESRNNQVVKSDADLYEAQAGRVAVDLDQKPADIDTNEFAARGAYRAFGLDDAQIQRILDYKQAKGQKLLTRDASGAQGTINVAIPYGDLVVAYGGDENNIPAEVRERFRNDWSDRQLKLATSEESLGKGELGDDIKARDILSAQNREFNKNADERLRDEALRNVMSSPFNTGDETAIQAEMERLRKLQLTRADKEEIESFALGASNAGSGASAVSGLVGAVGRSFSFAAGAMRPFEELGLLPEDWYTTVAKAGIKRSAGDETYARQNADHSKILRIAGGAALDVPRLVALSALPGGAMVGFALDSGLQSAGRGEGIESIAGETAKGAALGALFSGASKLAKAAEGGALRAFVNPVFEAGKKATAGQRLVAKVFGEGAKIGSIAAGTIPLERLAGATNEQAFDAAIQNALFDLVMTHGGGLAKGVAGLSGKVIRSWFKGQPQDVTVTPEGGIVRLGRQAEKEMVDAEMVLDPIDGIYKQKGNIDGQPAPERSANNRAQDVEAEPQVKEILGEPATPKALPAETPRRVETASPEAMQKASTDARAQKIAEAIKGKDAVSVDAIQKLTKYNRANVEDALLTLYGAKQIEILPDNTVRFIGGENGLTQGKSLFERAGEIDNSQPIELGRSPIENELTRIDGGEPLTPAPSPANRVPVNQSTAQPQAYQTDTNKPKATVIYAERPKNNLNLFEVSTERGTLAKVEPQVIDSKDIITSLDEGYPQELQPRDRGRQSSKAQIAEIANKLNPRFLDDSPKASDGRPLVVVVDIDGEKKYAVVSGNGRTEAIRTAYALGKGEDYRSFTNGKQANDLERPVYVGVLDPNEVQNLPEFAKEANESATAQMSATEQAKSDAERLGGDVLNLFVPTDDGSFSNAANRDFTRAFLGNISTTERNRLIDASGQLNQDGVARVKNAIFAKAFGDSERGLSAIQRMSESTDNNVKNITNGLLSKAGAIASLKQAVQDGKRHAEFDISNDLATAMEKYASLRDSNTSIDDYISQGNLFGADETPFQSRVIQVFDNYKRSPKAIRTILNNFLEVAEETGDPNQKNLFGENQKIDINAIFEGAVSHYEKTQRPTEAQADLFDQTDRGLQLRPQSGADNQADTAKEGARETESGTQGVDVPFFALPEQGAELEAPSLSRDLNEILEDSPHLTDLFAKGRVRVKASGELLVNPEAFRLIHEGLRVAFGDMSAFYGAYLNPSQTARFIDAMENNVLSKHLPAQYHADSQKFIENLKKGIDFRHGDLIILTSNTEYRAGLQSAVEEERAHRADYRAGERHAIARKVVLNSLAGRKAAANLKEGYAGTSLETRASETAAKIFVVDGEQELGLSTEQVDKLRLDLLEALFAAGKTSETIRENYQDISKLGEQFAEQAENYERKQREQLQRSGATIEQAESGRTPQLSAHRESDGRTGARGRSQSQFDFKEDSGNIGSGLLERVGQSELNESGKYPLERYTGDLAAGEQIPLFRKVKDEDLDADNIEEARESNFRKVLSYIYDGKRDVGFAEATMNVIRTGFLAGFSVIKTNLLGNTTNIVFEQAAKPFMAAADMMNPKAKERTVPGLSGRDVIQGFFGENGLFRSEVGFDRKEVGKSGILKSGVKLKKGFLDALVHGTDAQESARVDMNVANKKSSFVRNTGVPVIDASIELVKRIVTGIDRPFKAYARTAEISGRARLEASKNYNYFSAEWRKKLLELRSDPSRLTKDVAERYAEVVTFQNPNAVTRTYDDFRKFLIDEKAQARIINEPTKRKIAKHVGSGLYIASGQVAPFVSTPSNVGFRALEYFFPTGIVATAFKFTRIGKSLERKSYIEAEGAQRAKKVKRLAALRGRQDAAFKEETNNKLKRLNDQKKTREAADKERIEYIRKSSLTDAHKTERIENIRNAQEKWLEGWQKNRDKYTAERKALDDKATAQRKVVDEVQRKDWESEAAYADIKFTEFENRAFAEAAGRAGFGATFGSLFLLGVIYGLIKAVGTTDYDEDRERAQEMREGGIPNNTVEIGGYRFPYADSSFGKALSLGVNLFEQYEREGTAAEKATVMAKRFGKDVTSLNPLTSQEFTKDDWMSYAGSKANSMTPLLNMKILQEIGEVLDEKPRKYYEEGFAAQYLIKMPFGRELLPESESFIGGEEERGGYLRRAVRMLDPLKTTKPNIEQDDLSRAPAAKAEKEEKKSNKPKAAPTPPKLPTLPKF